jgi:hypothetical protein
VVFRLSPGFVECLDYQHIEEALDRRREFEEGEEWLARESHKTHIMLERIHQGQDDALFEILRDFM